MLGTATKLQNARSINGTNFDGSGNITTSKWGTSRNIALSGAVSGNANVDGSGNVTITTTQANISILNGNITLTDGTGSVDINYPSGYNKDNCIVISAGINIQGTGMDFLHSNSHYIYVRLKTNNITLYCDKILSSGSSGSKAIKIVLMKI